MPSGEIVHNHATHSTATSAINRKHEIFKAQLLILCRSLYHTTKENGLDLLRTKTLRDTSLLTMLSPDSPLYSDRQTRHGDELLTKGRIIDHCATTGTAAYPKQAQAQAATRFGIQF